MKNLVLKKSIIIAIAFLSLSSINTFAQEISGIATYKTSRKMQIELDSTDVNNEEQIAIQEMLKKQFEKTFTLEFSGVESLYKEKVKLQQNAPQSGEVVVMMVGGGEGEILYKNMKDQRFVKQADMMGKLFLIEDSLTPRPWVLTKESKMIGNYSCFKATYTFWQNRIRIDNHNGKEVEKRDSIEVLVEAWYTPQIPIKTGPAEYGGLPGLVMEVKAGNSHIMCSDISLNKGLSNSIEIPTKGKKVDQMEFQKVMQKKMKATRKQMGRQRRGRGNTRDVEIRIGG